MLTLTDSFTQRGAHVFPLLDRVAVRPNRSPTVEIDSNSTSDHLCHYLFVLLRACGSWVPHPHLDDRIQGMLLALLARHMQYIPRVHTHAAGTDVVARHGRNSDRHASSAVLCARLPQAECTSTAFMTLDAQAHDFFDLLELTHARHVGPRERTAMSGVREPM